MLFFSNLNWLLKSSPNWEKAHRKKNRFKIEKYKDKLIVFPNWSKIDLLHMSTEKKMILFYKA